MPTDRWLQHVTLTTGDSRRSFAAEVDRHVVEVCRDLIARMLAADPASVPIPGMDGYRAIGDASGKCLHVQVYGTAVPPIVVMYVGTHSKCGPRAWRDLHQYASEWSLPVVTDRERCPPEPWIGALLDVGAASTPPGDLMALADLERCIAWAWLAELDERRKTEH